MCFGDEQQQNNQVPDLNVEILPDLNAQEVPLSQNAPTVDDI
jgi:hypothetical protein